MLRFFTESRGAESRGVQAHQQHKNGRFGNIVACARQVGVMMVVPNWEERPASYLASYLVDADDVEVVWSNFSPAPAGRQEAENEWVDRATKMGRGIWAQIVVCRLRQRYGLGFAVERLPELPERGRGPRRNQNP